MQRMAAAMAGGPWPLRVYPSGREYVVSDDDFSLALYERAGLDEVTRFVLGGPPRVACRDVTPLGPGEAARLLGLQPRVEGGP